MSEIKAKKPENKYRVIPNMTPKGPDLMRMLQNGSLKGGSEGEYSMDEEIEKISKMSRADLKRESILGQEKVNQLENKLKNEVKTAEAAKKAEATKAAEAAKTA